MWFEIILLFILFKFKKKRPNISGIRVVENINFIQKCAFTLDSCVNVFITVYFESTGIATIAYIFN